MINQLYFYKYINSLLTRLICYKIMKKLLILIFITVFIFLLTHAVQAKPQTKTIYAHSLDGFARVKIKNNTTENLACYIAINGYKVKFRLPALRESKWYTATDKRLAYRNFSTWCDYLTLHPEYLKYK
jgi:hypothetical protein